MTTWKELAQEALDIQDACNLSAVVHTFSRVITEVRELLRAKGKESTVNVNMHPICVLFSNKISQLTGSEGITAFGDAYNWAKDKVNNVTNL